MAAQSQAQQVANGLATITLEGNVGTVRSLETIQINDREVAALEFSMAVNQKVSRNRIKTDWVSVQLYGPQAEAMADILKKGMRLTVVGDATVDAYIRTDSETGRQVAVGQFRIFRVHRLVLGPRSQRLTVNEIAQFFRNRPEAFDQVLDLIGSEVSKTETTLDEAPMEGVSPKQEGEAETNQKPEPVGVGADVTDDDVPF